MQQNENVDWDREYDKLVGIYQKVQRDLWMTRIKLTLMGFGVVAVIAGITYFFVF